LPAEPAKVLAIPVEVTIRIVPFPVSAT
jgi:hypothetical protein